MHIAVTGSSGLIGSALVASLRGDGHRVRCLVRRPPRDDAEMCWTPGIPDPATVEGCDAVVHLAGAGIGDRRWTKVYQDLVLRSRVDGTASLAGAIAAATTKPRVFLVGSAIGWYGETGNVPTDESAPCGDGWLADVVRRWEAAAAPAEDAGVRTVKARTGIVLAREGGALGRVLPLFQLGLGTRLGSGRQWFSWISLPDEIAALRFALEREEVSGPVNLVAPEPVTNADYTKAVGRALHRPAVLPAPAPALRLALGGFADEGLLNSLRLVPGVLQGAGFEWLHPRVDEALAAVLHRS